MTVPLAPNRTSSRTSIRPARTLDSVLQAANGHPAGFDYLRILLAAGIIAWHSFLITQGFVSDDPVRSAIAPAANLIVPMFFALSGFLVTGSLLRTRSIVTFLGLRALRIVPALTAEAIISALLVGPLLTRLPLADYLGSGQTWGYLLNILGDMHHTLPGVFATHPVDELNGQLWTVPYEELCYLALAALAVLGMVTRRTGLLLAVLLCHAAQIANTLLRPATGYAGAGGSTLLVSFMAGVLLFRFRDRVPWSAPLAALCLAASLLLPALLPKGMRFAPVPIAYVTIWLGLLNPPRSRILLGGDYSYGLYVFGFLMQQLAWAMGPPFRTWYGNLALALPMAAIAATLSWHLVEHPALRQRRHLYRLDAAWTARRSRRRVPA